jgi:pimeloyl-ACP methyl ester carboxylesterase
MTGEQILQVNGSELCAETFGDPGDPAILLIGGAAASMDYWEPDFCERLAAGGRYVIRYDHRDTGRSASSPAGAPAYTGMDLVTDPVGLLDALGIDRAHVVGLSMGGGLAQDLAAGYADRVATITLMSTSPAGKRSSDEPLPPSADRVQALFADPAPEPDWSDRAAVIEYLLDDLRPYAGTIPFDEAGMRAVVTRMVDRTTDIAASQKNHWILADSDDAEPIRMADITAPTLVLHGTEDPLFPLPHGEALAREIRGATLVVLDGVGHEYPPRAVWDTVVPAILDHTRP